MKIASFAGAAIPGTEPLDFFSDARLGGFDAVILDLEAALGAWLSRDDVWQAKAERVLTLAAHQRLVETLERRARELRKFIDEGRPAVLLPAVLPALKHVDKKGRFTDSELDSNVYPAAGVARTGGASLELRGPAELLAFAERLKPHFQPHATLPKHIGAPAFLSDGKVAGAFLCDGKRWVLTCPRLADTAELAAAFSDLFGATSAEAKLPDLPPWHEQYLIPGEAQMAALIEKIDQSLAEVLALRAQKLAEKAELGYLKRLFTDEGPSLRQAVAVALKAMGFDVQPGPRGKDELVITLKQAVAVVAIKGRTTAASEADAVDLDKAVHRHFKEHNVMPKGILVVNGFRDLPLHDRREAVFPPAMHGYAKNRGHCLITGLQLLCLQFEARNPEHGPRARNELLHTVGPFQRFRGGEWVTIFGTTPEGNPNA
ncbi:MAG TPA: hypothetical protein VEA99_10080 [Gemmatimonadaceae bacterium]|nr:hypothetical protein [Gemmatimonadaceae bacterium]